MAQKSLVSYIRQLLNKGYSIDQIRNELLRSGYDTNTINQAIASSYKSEIKHTIHFSRTTLIVIILLFLGLILVIAGVLFMNLTTTPEKILDIKTDLLKTAVKQNEKLEFTVELLSFGSKTRYDVIVSYNIVNRKTNDLLTSKTETIALETRTSVKSSIRIPEDAPAGEYTLKTIAGYNGKTAVAADNFRIYTEGEEIIETCDDEIKNQDEEEVDCGGVCEPCKKEIKDCNDDNKCTEDSFVNGECSNKLITPCCGNYLCETKEDSGSCPSDCPKQDEGIFAGLTTHETLEKIREISSADHEEAYGYCTQFTEQIIKDRCFSIIAEETNNIDYCGTINDERTKDKCYMNIAENTNNIAVCEKVVKDSRRDACYTNFVTKGDYSMCDKITNNYLRKSCEQLKMLESID